MSKRHKSNDLPADENPPPPIDWQADLTEEEEDLDDILFGGDLDDDGPENDKDWEIINDIDFDNDDDDYLTLDPELEGFGLEDQIIDTLDDDD